MDEICRRGESRPAGAGSGSGLRLSRSNVERVPETLNCLLTRHRFQVPAVLFSGILLLLVGACSTLVEKPVSTTHDYHTLYRLHEQAERAYATGEWRQAARYFTELNSQLPVDSFILTRLGSSWFQLGEFQLAQQAFQAALSQTPDARAAQRGLTLVYLVQAEQALLGEQNPVATTSPPLVWHQQAQLLLRQVIDLTVSSGRFDRQ